MKARPIDDKSIEAMLTERGRRLRGGQQFTERTADCLSIPMIDDMSAARVDPTSAASHLLACVRCAQAYKRNLQDRRTTVLAQPQQFNRWFLAVADRVDDELDDCAIDNRTREAAEILLEHLNRNWESEKTGTAIELRQPTLPAKLSDVQAPKAHNPLLQMVEEKLRSFFDFIEFWKRPHDG